MRRIIPFVALLAFFQVAVAQDTLKQKAAEPKKEKAAKTPEDKGPRKFRPSIGAGVGVTRFMGDVEDVNKTNIHVLGNRLAYDFTFKANLSRAFNISINTVFGKVSGNENEHRNHRNFESEYFTMGLNLEYNFRHFYKNKKGKPFLTPFISAGVYYADYNPRSDLYDADGNPYYYWKDGFIRNMPEASSNPDEVKLVERDFNYETHLTETPVKTVAFPVAGGFDMHLGDRVTFRVSSSYFFTMSDKVDNFDNATYSKYNDGYFYNSVAVFFNFLSDRKEKTPGVDPDIYFYDFKALDEDDTDNDGVPDLADKCGNTPSAVKVVDESGCPLDSDKDGIADYLDKEPGSKFGSVVDGDGVTVNFMKVAERASDSISMKRSQVSEQYVNSPRSTNSQYTVHVATVSKSTSAKQKDKLKTLTGLTETKKDSLTIYTLGNYSSFEEAEKKQNELISKGFDEAFAATPKAVDAISVELEKRAKGQKVKNENAVQVASKTNIPADVDVVKFKVQISEYRLRLQINKLADMMAREGVELKTTTGGLKIYTIGSYDTFEEAQKVRREIISYGVKEAEVIGSINNKTVSVDEAKRFLENQK